MAYTNSFDRTLDEVATVHGTNWNADSRIHLFAEFLGGHKYLMYEWKKFLEQKAEEELIAFADAPAKRYEVYYRVTTSDRTTVGSGTVTVTAKSEPDARRKAEEWVREHDPRYDDRIDPCVTVDAVVGIEDDDDPVCRECGEPCFVDADTGVSHHYKSDSIDDIDHDADLDHVAIPDPEPS